jgi:Methyltransferase domain
MKYEQTAEWNQKTNEEFFAKVNETLELKELRDWVESKIFGFGERSFYWMWKLIVDEMPQKFSFLEIGVFRGQTTALIMLLAKMQGKEVTVYGVTPLDSTGGHWESDYGADIKLIHETFKLEQPNLLIGLSTNPDIIAETKRLAPFDIVYIDGGHSYEVALSDLNNYSSMTSNYLVIDDCCNDIPMPHGYFTGIQSVTDALRDFNKEGFELQYNVVHNKVFKKC